MPWAVHLGPKLNEYFFFISIIENLIHVFNMHYIPTVFFRLDTATRKAFCLKFGEAERHILSLYFLDEIGKGAIETRIKIKCLERSGNYQPYIFMSY